MKLSSFLISLRIKLHIFKRLIYNRFLNLTGLDKLIIKHFNVLYYETLYFANFGRYWNNAYWLGIPTQKIPTDLWVYQEIIFEQKPDVIIECGTANGGSALYLASICDLVHHGRIISIDIIKYPNLPKHRRITYLNGSSISKKVEQQVKKNVHTREKVMVILDSEHTKDHVLSELKIYSKFVTKGSYLIVEDTNLGHPIPGWREGPWEAVEKFLDKNVYFLVDSTKEKFYLTCNPHGYLKKIK